MTIIASNEDPKSVIRFPGQMRDALTEAAFKEGRSRNAEIVKRLKESLERDGLDPRCINKNASVAVNG